MRSVERFLRTLQHGGDLVAQLEAVLNQRRPVHPSCTARIAGGSDPCEKCVKGAEDSKREREARIELEEKCEAQQRRIAELEELLSAMR